MRDKNTFKKPVGGFAFLILCAVWCMGFSPNAMAVWVNITAPANGAEFRPGDTVPVTVSFGGSVAGVETLTVILEGSEGQLGGFVADYGPYPPALSDTVSYNIPIPAWVSAPQTLTLWATVTDYVDGDFDASISISLVADDTTPPHYLGAAGILSAARPSDNTLANLTWNAATDDISASSAIIYNVYAATTQAAVFTGNPVKTFTGTTSGQVTGLDAQTHYYFGVRAEDEAGNEETNANTALARHAIEPAYGRIVETFDCPITNVLDSAGPEVIGTAATSLFAWGGFDAGTDATVSMDAADGLLFASSAKSAGSYAYTRFGKPSLPGGLSNAAERILNMTGRTAKAGVELNTAPASHDDGSTVALMIRDNQGWWQSSGMTLQENPSTANTSTFQFSGSSAVTWKHLLNTDDVDEVDNGGETALAEGTAGTPNLGRIEGMGVRILESSGGANPLYIRSITLYGSEPASTDRGTWNMYR